MRIDAHIHVTADAPEATDFMAAADLKFLNISVAFDNDWRRDYHEPFSGLALRDPGRFAWSTSFDLPGFPDLDYAERTIAGLERDFGNGAVACKVWKNIGMELKDDTGRYVQIDHPVFTPILDYLEREERTLIAHLGEPLACWQPLDPKNPHYDYYSQNPEWHMHGRSGFPSHTEIIAARDRVLERHPRLQFVGAHLGSLEYDVAEVADRFERFPSFSVDVSARLGDLMNQDPAKVRAFFLKYPDRIVFGTDIVMLEPFSQLSPEIRADRVEELSKTYEAWFRFFETNEVATLWGQAAPGIRLPTKVLDLFYRDNAIRLYPGIADA